MKHAVLIIALLLYVRSINAQTKDTSIVNKHMPEYPGGLQKFNEYIWKTINYPITDRDNNIEGVVYVHFTITTSGAIDNIQIKSSPSESMSKEVLRVFSAMPKWKPGTLNGVAIQSDTTVAVYFTLNSNQELQNTQPDFPGGEKALSAYLSRHIHYPDKAFQKHIEGIVIVDFTVTTTGDITGIKIKSSPLKAMSNEAIRVIKTMPKWRCAIQNGIPVNMPYTLSVKFTLPKTHR